MAVETTTKGWLRTASLALLVATAAACGEDATGPGSDDPFDPAQTSEDFATMQSALDANADVAEDLAYVSASLESMPAASWVLETKHLSVGSTLARPITTTRLSATGSSRPLLPSDLLGTTFEWDAGENGYVATARAGAPANGVRFILYDRTATPLVENGFADVTDDSDASADRLGVHLEKDGVTRLDYEVEVVETTSGGSVSVAGFLTDGNDQIDFDVVETVVGTSEGFRIDVDYSLSLAGQPLGVELDYFVDFGSEISLGLTALFVNGANQLVLDMEQNGDGAVEGTVEWNGALAMTISDDGTGQPVFLGPEGEELTAEEAQAIQEMFEIAVEGLDFLAAYVVFLGESVA